MSSRNRQRAIAALATTAIVPALMPVFGIAPAAATTAVEFEVVADGLDSPRGLAFGSDGALYVAESGRGGDDDCIETEELGLRCFGATGAVTRVDLDAETQERVAEDLPSIAGEDGAEATGPTDVVVAADGRLLVTIGLGADPAARAEFGAGAERLGHLLSVDPASGAATVVADVAGYEADADPDEAGPDSNPNAVLQVDGQTLVADAGGNSVVSVGSDGSVDLVAVLEDRLVDTPPFIPNAPPQIPMQAVPTSLAVGEDGQVLVGQLTGFPFPVGGALVWSLDPAADRPTAPEEFFGGFTNIMDVAQRDDDTFVLEYATNSLLAGEDAVGAIARLRPDGTVQRIGQDVLRSPGGMAVGPDGALYVTNTSVTPGEGQVLRLDPSLAGDPRIQAACPPDDIAFPPFTDIAGSVHEEAIACLWWWEIARGTSGSTFSPGQSLTRGQVASLLVRAAQRTGVALPTAPPDAFSDDEGSVHEGAIDVLAAVGVLRGTGDGRVAPGAVLSRGQMASLVARAAQVLTGAPLPVTGDGFTDDAGSVHEESINQVATAGWMAGTGSGLFRPSAPMSREQASTVLARIASTLVQAGVADLPDPVSAD